MTVTISRAVLFGGQESLSHGGHIRQLQGRGALIGIWAVRGCRLFTQEPSLLGRQLVQGSQAFTQAHPLQEPVLLHLQHGITVQSQQTKKNSNIPVCNIKKVNKTQKELQDSPYILENCDSIKDTSTTYTKSFQ